MELILKVEKHEFFIGETIWVYLFALNNSYKPVRVDRRLLIGPNPVHSSPIGAPFPVSIEPAFPEEEKNIIMLNPWCFYGRLRRFDYFPEGQVTIYAYLLRQPIDSLLPQGPGEPAAPLASAEPLVITIIKRNE